MLRSAPDSDTEDATQGNIKFIVPIVPSQYRPPCVPTSQFRAQRQPQGLKKPQFSLHNSTIRPGQQHQQQQLRSFPAEPLPVCGVCLSEGRAFRHDVIECRFVRPCDRYAVQAFSRQVDTRDSNEQQRQDDSS